MENKQRHKATCPRFISRVDYKGRSAIQCAGWNLFYFDRQERDADYLAACCGDRARCPLKRVPSSTIMRAARSNGKAIPNLWPTTTKYPTNERLYQEAQKHERT